MILLHFEKETKISVKQKLGVFFLTVHFFFH